MNLELRLAQRLSIRAAIIEYMRWDGYNIPSTTAEIATAIRRHAPSVQRAIRALVRDGAMVRFQMRSPREIRYMLADAPGRGARLLQNTEEAP